MRRINTKGWPIEKRLAYYSREASSGCRIWIGCCDKDGYGLIWYQGRMQRVNRVVWSLKHGTIPKAKQILHECDTPGCIADGHLWCGSNAENRADSVAKRRHAYGVRQGHAKLTPSDVIAIRTSNDQQRKIARDFGICQSNVWAIRRGLWWKHV